MAHKKRNFTLIKPSTRAFTREARKIEGFTFWEYIHGLLYARFPYLYISIGTGEHPLVKRFGSRLAPFLNLFDPGNGAKPDEVPPDTMTFADTYHGKVMPVESAKKLVMVNEPVNLPDLEKVIPYKKARSIILENPDHIVALDCPCRLARENPCLPLDVCLIVGEPFASYIHEHLPDRSRWITQEEAVGILQAEDERGHVHHAFFKDAMLGRYYAICNCCSCCCGAMQAQRNGTPMLASSGYLSQIDEDLCIGCGTCVEYCQFGALSVPEFTAQVDEAVCMGCGVCVTKCDQDGISLYLAPQKGEPLEICDLMEAAIGPAMNR